MTTTVNVVLVIALASIFLGLPKYWQQRNAAYYSSPPRISFPQHVRSGTVSVIHSPEILKRVADRQGEIPNVPVKIAFQTSYDEHRCDAAKHIVLVHGTAVHQDVYYQTVERMKSAGYPAADIDVLPEALREKSISDRLHDAGMCVTTVDLRGHGRSEVTPGPYTVSLLAADVAAALKLIHGDNVKVHISGLSLGMGVVMSLAFNYPEMVRTVSGNGFLADRTTVDFAPYIFSRSLVVDLLGMELLGKAAEQAIICAPKGFLPSLFSHAPIEGYKLASASWLNYNESDKLKDLQPAMLWLLPIRDDLCGVTIDLVKKEIKQVPLGKLVVFNTTKNEDHCHQIFNPDEFYEPVINWIKQFPTGRKNKE